MQTKSLLVSGVNDHAELEISVHQIFFVHQSMEESVFGLVGYLEKTPFLFLFLKRLQFPRRDMKI